MILSFAPRARPRYRDRHDYDRVLEPFALQIFLVTLTGPTGQYFIIADRLDGGSIGTISSITEENFLELVHGDVSLNLFNDDNGITQFFSGVDPADIYELTIDRYTGKRRGKWERIFGGILDLPWSLRFNAKTRTASLRAFSYSKLLERASAEVVKRSVDDLTGSVTAASKVVTVTSTTNLRADDIVRFRDNTNDEDQQIAKILTGTTFQTVEAWAHTFANPTPLTVETPYPRDMSVQELADALFTAAGITSRDISIINPLAAFPIATPMNTTSYPRDVNTGIVIDPKSITQRGANLDWRLTDGATNTRAETDDPAHSWNTFTSGVVLPINDWTPYYDVEPANFPTGIDFDDGKTFATDHEVNDLWELELAGSNIKLRKDGAPSGAPDIFDIGGAGVSSRHRSIELDPIGGGVWMSLTGKTTDAPDKDGLKVWDGAVLSTLASNFSGEIRFLRRLNVMAVHEYDPEDATNGFNPTTNMRIYDRGTGVVIRTVTVPENLYAWTLRVYESEEGIRIAGLYTQLDTTRIRIWDDNWTTVADYQVAGKASGVAGTRAFLTVFTNSAGAETLVGQAGRVLFVLGKGYRGVVPYADMSGKSCAEGLRQLALISMAYIEVDEFKIGTLLGRGTEDVQRRAQAIPVDVPSERVTWPVFEFYRTSARISGQDPSGETFEVVVGDTGDSAHRISLDGDLVSSGGLAEAIGLEYVSFLGVPRTQEEIEIPETGRLIRAFDYVRLDAGDYIVVESRHNLKDRRYSLRLVAA